MKVPSPTPQCLLLSTLQDYVSPVLVFALYCGGFMLIHEVFSPSGRLPAMPEVTIEVSERGFRAADKSLKELTK